MIIIKEVKTKKEKKDFVNFPIKLYKDNPYFIPPLYGDEMALMNKDNMYSDQADAIYFLAYINSNVVGRISGILQKVANDKFNQKRIRFTRFDSIDNQEVANALFDAVATWAKSKGMDEIVGPLGFSDLEREGLLIEGFNELCTFEEQYNFPYYQKLIENYGFEKEIDWVERRLTKPDKLDERVKRLSDLMLRKYNLHHAVVKNKSDFIKRYATQFFDILDETYVNIYGSVPFTPKMRRSLISSFKLVIDINYVSVIVNENDKVVAFGLAFPAFGEALQMSGGKLTLPAIIRVLKALKSPKGLDLGLIGVIDEYKSKGIASSLIAVVLDALQNNKIEYAETNLNLETNTSIINMWKVFNSRQHKRRRAFVKKI